MTAPRIVTVMLRVLTEMLRRSAVSLTAGGFRPTILGSTTYVWRSVSF